MCTTAAHFHDFALEEDFAPLNNRTGLKIENGCSFRFEQQSLGAILALRKEKKQIQEGLAL